MTEDVSMTSHFATFSGCRVHYQTAGDGDPLMLIHGGGPGAFGYSNYRYNIYALSQNHRVILIDLPGFGQSDTMPIQGSMFEAMAAAAFSVLDDMDVKEVSVVGNSLGGGTALCMALAQPQRINKLVLMGPGGGLPMHTPFPTEGLLRMMRFYEGEPPTKERLKRVIELLVYDSSRMTNELLEERFKAAMRADIVANPPLKGRGAHPNDQLWRAPLETLYHPVLIIWGKEDRILPMEMAFPFLKILPNAELHIFPHCGHWVQWEKSEQFNRLVDNFVRS